MVYLLAPASRFEAKTGKAGLFGFAGHEHLVRARSPSGRIIYRPSRPADSRVEIVVAAESLEVLTPPDTAEIRKVTAALRTEILRVDRCPVIRFASTAVTPTSDGLRVQGSAHTRRCDARRGRRAAPRHRGGYLAGDRSFLGETD